MQLIMDRIPPLFEDRLGRCYELAAQFAMDNEQADPVLVHGTIENPRLSTFGPLPHAWVKVGEHVFEPASGELHDVYFFEQFYHPAVFEEYDYPVMCRTLLAEGNYGAWDEQSDIARDAFLAEQAKQQDNHQPVETNHHE